MKILISNDDGIYAPGIICLRDHLSKVADVTVVAPESQQSATGHSVTLSRPISMKQISKNEYSVAGTPTDSVKLGLLTVLKDDPPDMIVSGINWGGNLGEDITYSGTVGNALEGTINGIPSIAVSLVVKKLLTQGSKPKEPKHFETAAKFILKFIDFLKDKSFPKRTLFNVNVPNIPYNELKGVEFTRMGKRCYCDEVTEIKDPFNNPMYWFTASFFDLSGDVGTDSRTILDNKISITPLHIEYTNFEYLDEMKNNWELTK